MARFNNLPTELVDAILQAICLHCSPGRDRCCSEQKCKHPNPPYTAQCRRVRALAALCRTSRRLNSLATAHLYHRIVCDRPALLAQTLFTRRDLALLVRDLRVDDSYFVPAHLAPKTLAHFAQQFKAYEGGLQSAEEDDPAQPPGTKTKPKNHRPKLPEDGNIAADILTSLCPNLQALHAETVPFFDAFRLSPPTSLPHLHTLSIRHGSEDYNTGIDLANLTPLFLAAPNLRTMTFTSASECSSPLAKYLTLDKVTFLSFDLSALDSRSLCNILAACPNLEELEYTPGGDAAGNEQFGLLEARDAVQAHAPRLRRLRLDDADGYSYPEWDRASARELARAMAESGVRFEFVPEEFLKEGWLGSNVKAGPDSDP